MRLRPIIIAAGSVAGGAVILLIAGFVLLRSMDLDSYRPEIIARVKAATGRELAIGGDLGVGFSHGLVIHADRLSLGNAAWGSRPQMLTLARIDAHLALLPLLRGQFQITRLTLHGVDLLLESNASGTANWMFGAHPASGTPSPIDVRSVVIESGQLGWRSAGASLQLAELTLAAEMDGDRLQIKAGGRVGDEQLALSGRIPSPPAWGNERPWDFDLRLTALGGEMTATGTLQRDPPGLSPALSLRAKRLNIAGLARLAGKSWPPLPALDMAFDLSRDGGGWRVTNLTARAGNSDLTGEMQLTPDSVPPQLSASLTSQRIDLAALSPEIGKSVQKTPAQEGEGSAAASPSTGFGALRTLNGTLKWRVAELTGPGRGLQNVQLDGHLEAGRLTLSPLQADTIGGGRLQGRLALDASKDAPEWSLGVTLRRTPAAALLGPEHASLIEAPLDLDLNLNTRGASQQRIASELAGHARLLVNKGRARLKTIDTLVGGLSTLTGQLMERGTDDAQLNCIVADFTIDRGVAEANVLLIDSAVSTVRGDGHVDLGAGKFDLTFTPHPKKPTLSVAVPVHVRGPLLEPEFTADREGSIMKLIGVASLFVYPPAALATLGELGDSDNECLKLMQGGSAAQQSDSTIDKVQKGAMGAVDSIGRGLDKLFGR